MSSSASLASLVHDLRALGVGPGDLLFVHSSFKSLGPVDGAAAAVVAALREAIGEEGLLAMPSFHLIPGGRDARAAAWNHAATPSTVGWLTEFFRLLPGTVRSDHYSHAVAAAGRGAAEFVAEHRSGEGMRSPWDLAPWGATYGERSPMLKAYRHPRGKVLMLGVDYHSSTWCHLVEVIDWNRRLAANPEARYAWIDRDRAGDWWDRQGRLRRGPVAQADCRLFRIREFVDSLAAAMQADPHAFLKPATPGPA